MHNAQLPQVRTEGGGWLGLVGELIIKFARGGGDFKHKKKPVHKYKSA